MQIFPESIPARSYISHGVAQALGLPYTVKEAWSRYRAITEECKRESEKEDGDHAEQMKLCVSLLELGWLN